MAVYYIKDVTVTGTEDSPQTISYSTLEDITSTFLPASFDSAPMVTIYSTFEDTNIILTSAPGTDEFYVAMSDIRGDITVTSVVCNIIITTVVDATSWTTKIATTQITSNTTENTDNNIYMFRDNYLFVQPIPEEIWELELLYRYNVTINDISGEIDLPQNFSDFLEDRILADLLELSITNDDGSIRTGVVAQARGRRAEYQNNKLRAKQEIHSNVNVGEFNIKPCKW